MHKIIPEYRGLGPLAARSGCVHLEDHQTGQSLVYPPVNSEHDLIRILFFLYITLTFIQSNRFQICTQVRNIKNKLLGINFHSSITSVIILIKTFVCIVICFTSIFWNKVYSCNRECVSICKIRKIWQSIQRQAILPQNLVKILLML